MKSSFSEFSGGVCLVSLDDRTRLPWRFFARHMAIDWLTPHV